MDDPEGTKNQQEERTLSKARKDTPQYQVWLEKYLAKRHKQVKQNSISNEGIHGEIDAVRTLRFNRAVNAAWDAAGPAAKGCFDVVCRQSSNDGKELSRGSRIENQLRAIINSQVLGEVSYEDLIREYPRLTNIEGAEAKIFMADGDDYVLKLQDFRNNSDTPEDYLFNRIFLHNLLFPSTAYSLEAICLDTEDDNPSFKFLVSQPFIAGNPPSFDAFEKYMESLGFYHDTPNTYSNGVVRICDVPAANVLQGDLGEFYFIDPVIEPIFDDKQES